MALMKSRPTVSAPADVGITVLVMICQPVPVRASEYPVASVIPTPSVNGFIHPVPLVIFAFAVTVTGIPEGTVTFWNIVLTSCAAHMKCPINPCPTSLVMYSSVVEGLLVNVHPYRPASHDPLIARFCPAIHTIFRTGEYPVAASV